MNEFIPNRYKILQKIGEGVHGVVLKAIDTLENNKIVAIKKVSLRTKFGGLHRTNKGSNSALISLFAPFRHLAKHSPRD
jgi:serine/threonine protein kinase